MTTVGMERRRYKRIYFSVEDRILATFSFSNKPEDLFEANVMDLSEGGLFIATNKEPRFNDVAEGIVLVLTKIEGTTPSIHIDPTSMEIRWRLLADFLDHRGFGCEFINPTESTRKQILQIVGASGE